MSNKHKLEFTDDEFETLHILVNGAIQKLEAMPRVDLMVGDYLLDANASRRDGNSSMNLDARLR